MRGTDPSVIERPYDGCGECLIGVLRLSRVSARMGAVHTRT
ncbi:hypothetical protein STRTUCAR8_00921 [Streptomyces turgidiscabies Car8]|uniref:Uncharacterized protein n=1 Tax=Streptomyces turgidiscabies (strain Car8) TaxID=698760 RepID=L7EVR2_STRT8|nr:hypothetical protein STRTUCAR8_00921 [Streptomyces turgidiscabies Car8]